MIDFLNVEPLKDLLDIYTDKNRVFMYYLNNDVLDKIDGFIYYEDHLDQLFVYDKIYCIDKSTLKNIHHGQIMYHTKSEIIVKIKNKYSIHINPKQYYIFYKRKLKKNSKKDFMISLLKIL